MYQARITGIGSYVPERRLTNQDLEKIVDTSDEWIVTRTGISERRLAAPEQATSDLAYEAAVRALHDAGLTGSDLDLIIVGTVTPDHLFPSVATQLQQRLGCRAIRAFDVQAACTGFLVALETAHQFVRTGLVRNALVIGADTISRITDYTDRGTCILFSDGAGAMVLSRSDANVTRGLIHTATHTDGEHFHALYVPGGGSRHPEPDGPATKRSVVMEGNKIFKLAVQAMAATIEETLQATGYTADDLDWVVPHQANQRIIDAIVKGLHLPAEKAISTIKHYGNNSAATIPLAFDQAVREGRIKRGHLVMLAAFGGGLTWGSALLEY